MTTQEPSEESTPNSFVCACEQHLRQACDRKDFYKKKEGKRYCVLHYPGDEKVAAFRIALNNKLVAKDYNFNGVWFPKGVSFKELPLEGTANFNSASFNGDIDFSGVEFHIKALFNNASFNAGVNFSKAIFSGGADFSGACFDESTHFNEADFRRSADFSEARFTSSVDFSRARFNETVNFFKANFGLSASFISASFNAAAVFDSASFSADADFSHASFIARAEFINTNFSARAEFINAGFSAVANFTKATFIAVTNFTKATFIAAVYFHNTIFSKDADFSSATFIKDAGFRFASFSTATDFSSATFSAVADFGATIFSADAVFKAAIFKDHVNFGGQPKRKAFGDQTQLTFQSATFEKPDRVSFHTLDLKPHWFIDVDTRKFTFTDVEFNYDLKDGLESLKKAGVGAPHRLLAIACRQLAVNAEENHRYRQAADFRYATMNAVRLEWLQDRKIKKFQFLHWLYWIASGYGERVTRAFWMLIAVWLVFAFLYTKVGFEHKTNKPATDQQSIAVQVDEVGKPLPLKKVLTYSLGVMSLQKPDPKPVTIAGQTLLILETILGPLQAALLALAIRRRFMR